MGNISKVVRQLSKERARLTDELHRVTAALTAFGKVYLSGNNPNGANRTKRTISVAGRKRIAAAQRARWAKQKRAQKPKRTMSASARRKIALAQRKRWAKLKAGQKK
jgi:16S rRNA G1207 methylase RsmC